MRTGETFDTFTLRHIWHDANDIFEQATFIVGNGSHFYRGAPVVGGTLVSLDEDTYAFVVDQEYQELIPALYSQSAEEPHIFKIIDLTDAVGDLFFMGRINLAGENALDGRRAYFRIARLELYADFQGFNSILGRFVYLEGFIRWRYT